MSTDKTPERLCVFCEHYRWLDGWGSESMGSWPGRITCDAGQWEKLAGVYSFEVESDREGDYRRAILLAEKCPEYKLVKK